MKRNILMLSVLCFATARLCAQDNVGIGTLTPNASAILELSSNSKGFLLPRVSLQSNIDVTTISNPEISLLVYNTNTGMLNANGAGFYYWNGTEWIQAVGPQGIQGVSGTNGQDGISVNTAVVDGNGDLIITLSNSQTVNAGNVIGPQGTSGVAGADGVGINTAVVNGNGDLILTLTNSQTINTGNVIGPQGQQGIQGNPGTQGPQGTPGVAGAAGVNGIGVSTAVVNGNGDLILTLTNNQTINTGNVIGPQGLQGIQGIQGIQGPQGNNGQNGVSVTNATVNGSGNLILTLSNSQTINTGSVIGPQGSPGPQGPQGPSGSGGTPSKIFYQSEANLSHNFASNNPSSPTWVTSHSISVPAGTWLVTFCGYATVSISGSPRFELTAGATVYANVYAPGNLYSHSSIITTTGASTTIQIRVSHSVNTPDSRTVTISRPRLIALEVAP